MAAIFRWTVWSSHTHRSTAGRTRFGSPRWHRSCRVALISRSSGWLESEKAWRKAMTEKTVRPRSVLRRTMLVGTAGVLGGAVLRPTPVQSQTGAAPAAAVPGSAFGARYG